MKILYIIDSLTAGGKERRLVELIKGLKNYSDIQCELAIMSNDIHYHYVFKQGIRIHYLIRKWKKDPRIFFKLYKLCKEFKPDIMHSWGSMPPVYAVPIAKLLVIKFINAMITFAPPRLKVFSKSWTRSKLTFPFSDIILSNSYAGLKSFNTPKNKSYCIPNGFDFSRLTGLEDEEKIREKFDIGNEKVVGMVANFTDRKDYKTYIAAAQMILHKRDDVNFFSIGDGNYLQKCKEMVKSEFQNKIKFLGRQENVESIMNICDVGVLSTYTEGISNSIMEYMALGKPVIATEGGGTKELIIAGESGFLINPKSPEELVEKIEFLLDNETFAKSMGKKGKERIKEEFSIEKMTNEFIQIYQGICAE